MARVWIMCRSSHVGACAAGGVSGKAHALGAELGIDLMIGPRLLHRMSLISGCIVHDMQNAEQMQCSSNLPRSKYCKKLETGGLHYRYCLDTSQSETMQQTGSYRTGESVTLENRPTALRTLPPGDLELTSGVQDTPKYSASSPFSPTAVL